MRSIFAANPLCRLWWPDDFGGMAAHPPDYSGWVGSLGGAILESLQGVFAERWLAVERGKRGIGNWPAMQVLGEAQEMVLDRFAEAIERSGRFDLARFLLQAAGAFWTEGRTADDLIGGLQGSGPRRLADRAQVHRRAAVMVRFMERMAGWERTARGVGYHDEGYAAAQLFKAEWEAVGASEAARRSQKALQQLLPMTIGPGGRDDEPSLSHPHQ
jgi:hypothetical protein